MNELEQLLEQDLAKIIIAIAVLIVILIIVFIYASISSRRKKSKLDNTRTLHKEEFEKAAKKRMELTQTISREDIKKELEEKQSYKNPLEQTVVPRSSAKSVSEKTMELNLESVRKKLLQDEKYKQNTQELDITMEELVAKATQSDNFPNSDTNNISVKEEIKVEENIAPTTNEEIKEEAVTQDLKIEENEVEKTLEDVAATNEASGFDYNQENNVFDVESAIIVDKSSEVIKPNENGELELLEDSFEDKDILDSIVVEASSEVIAPPGELLSTEDAVLFDDFIGIEGMIEEPSNDLNVIESFDIVEDLTDFDNNIFVDSDVEFAEIEPEVEIDIWDDNFGLDDEDYNAKFSEDFIESGLHNSFISHFDDEPGTLPLFNFEIKEEEFVLENDFESNFEFGRAYYEFESEQVENELVINDFIFGRVYKEDEVVSESVENVVFDFGLSREEEIEEDEASMIIFDSYYDADYTFEESEQVSPIFVSDSYEIELEDMIDSTLTKAVVTDGEVVVAQTTNSGRVIDEDISFDEVTLDDEYQDLVIKGESKKSSLVVQKPDDNDTFVVDITSQLDKLDTYEVNLLDEFDFTDNNYNYNFNSINIMEEIVEDMLLDEFVEPSEDEYFKYVYQFALLENMIEPKNINVNFDDISAGISIVEGVEEHLRELKVKMKQSEEVVDIAQETDDIVEIVNNLTHKTFEVDSELLDLTSKVIDRVDESDETSIDKAYSGDVYSSQVFSPVFFESSEDDIEKDFADEYEIDDSTAFLELEKLVSENSEEEQVNDDVVSRLTTSSTLEELMNEKTNNQFFELSLETEEDMFEQEDVSESPVDDFLEMINEKMEEENDPENEDEFLDVLKNLIK